MPDEMASAPAATSDRAWRPPKVAALHAADLENRAPTGKISRVQIAVLGLDHLFQQRHLARGVGLVRRTRFDEIVDQLLAIVEIAEEVLRLFQLAYRRVPIAASHFVGNLHRITHLLDGDTRAMHAIREVHARRMVDRLGRGGSALAKGVTQVALPGRAGADGPGDRPSQRKAVIVEHLNHAYRLEPLQPFDQLPQQRKALLFALLPKDDERGRRMRHPRFERCEQRHADIGVADAAE